MTSNELEAPAEDRRGEGMTRKGGKKGQKNEKEDSDKGKKGNGLLIERKANNKQRGKGGKRKGEGLEMWRLTTNWGWKKVEREEGKVIFLWGRGPRGRAP